MITCSKKYLFRVRACLCHKVWTKPFCLLPEINWRSFPAWEAPGWFEVTSRRSSNDKKRVERKVRADYSTSNKTFKPSDHGVMAGTFSSSCRGCGACNISYLGCCCDTILCMSPCLEPRHTQVWKKMLIVETVHKSAPHFDQLSLSLTFLFTLALPLYVQKFEERSCSSHNTPLEGWVWTFVNFRF